MAEVKARINSVLDDKLRQWQLNTTDLDFAKFDPRNFDVKQIDWRLVVGALLLTVVLSFSIDYLTKPSFPFVNYHPREITYHLAKLRYIRNANDLIAEGFKKFKSPISLVTDFGPKVIFPHNYVDAINAEPSLLFHEASSKEMFGEYPGFDAFKVPPPGLIEDVVRIKITRNLPNFTSILSEEADGVLKETFGDDPAWRTTSIREDILKIIARLSARTFVGKKLAHDQRWTTISITYTVNSFIAASILRMWPAVLRPVVHWFIPHCIIIRNQVKQARRLLAPIIKARDDEIREAIKNGVEPPKYNDAIQWYQESAKGKQYDPVISQLSLAMAAIHTTSDLLHEAVHNLCLHPEVVPALREEAIAVLSKGGWAKTSLYEMKRIDSFLKETQRFKPMATISMGRLASKDVTLSDGTFIPKGTSIAVSADRMWSPEVHENPDKFDAERFLRMRETPGQEHKSHLVSTGHDHMAFSHGKHACPGRFFAANETKIAFVHILLKYDVRVCATGKAPASLDMGVIRMADQSAKIDLRRRKEEIAIPI